MTDAIANLYFMDVPEGRAFYPLGNWGRGYLVDAEAERSLKVLLKRLRWFVPVVLPIALTIRAVVEFSLWGTTDHHPFWFFLVLVPIVVLIQIAVLKWQVRGRTPTAVRMTLAMSIRRAADAMSPVLVGTSMIACALMFGAMVVMMVVVGETGMAVLGLAVGVAIVVFYGLVAREQARRRDGAGPSNPRLRQP